MDRFPVLYTRRLKLRKLQIEDVDRLVQLADNRKVSDYIINIPHPYREPDGVFRIGYVHRGYVNKTHYVFAITLTQSDELVGEISLHLLNDGKTAELGYWVGEEYWNQGIASESIHRILLFGYDVLSLDQIAATSHTDNVPSSQVLLKNGMTRQSITGNVATFTLEKELFFTKFRPDE